MADNPRLIIELQDRSGASGAATPNPNRVQDTPTGDSLKDFHKKVTEEGADGAAVQSTPPPTTNPIGEALDNQSRQNIPASSPVPQPVNPIYTAVQGLYAADPRLSVTDLVNSPLGLTAQTAQEMLDRARGTNQPPPPTIPQSVPNNPPPSAPSTGDGYGGLPSGSAFRPTGSSSSDIDVITGLRIPPPTTPTVDDGYGTLPGRGNAFAPSGPAVDPVTGRPQDIPPAPVLRPDDGYGTVPGSRIPSSSPQGPIDDNTRTYLGGEAPPPPEAPITQDASGSQVANALDRALRVTGLQNTGIGNAVERAINTIPSLAPQGFGSIGTALAGLAIPASVVGAGAGVIATAYYTADNEARRAVRLSEEFSPELNQSLAQAEVRQIMANFRTARKLGDEAADYVTQTSRINESGQRIRDVFAEPIIQILNENLKLVADGLAVLAPITELAGNTGLTGVLTEFTAAGYWNLILPGLGQINYLARKANNWFNKEEEKSEEFLTMLDINFPHLLPPGIFQGHTTDQTPDKIQFAAPVPGLNI